MVSPRLTIVSEDNGRWTSSQAMLLLDKLLPVLRIHLYQRTGELDSARFSTSGQNVALAILSHLLI
jgi:hypothetical protein